jgi:hypothetical protein
LAFRAAQFAWNRSSRRGRKPSLAASPGDMTERRPFRITKRAGVNYPNAIDTPQKNKRSVEEGNCAYLRGRFPAAVSTNGRTFLMSIHIPVNRKCLDIHDMGVCQNEVGVRTMNYSDRFNVEYSH